MNGLGAPDHVITSSSRARLHATYSSERSRPSTTGWSASGTGSTRNFRGTTSAPALRGLQPRGPRPPLHDTGQVRDRAGLTVGNIVTVVGDDVPEAGARIVFVSLDATDVELELLP